jgi:hypothetical protein
MMYARTINFRSFKLANQSRICTISNNWSKLKLVPRNIVQPKETLHLKICNFARFSSSSKENANESKEKAPTDDIDFIIESPDLGTAPTSFSATRQSRETFASKYEAIEPKKFKPVEIQPLKLEFEPFGMKHVLRIRNIFSLGTILFENILI